MIENDILRDVLLEDERVPSTNELAKLYAINPSTAAKGINILVDAGILYKKKSIDGYTINTTPQTVKIEYKDQNVMVQAESTTIKNSRQKAEVSVVKKDSDTDNPLTGGQYTLYAGNDIKNYDGRVIVTKGAALQTVMNYIRCLILFRMLEVKIYMNLSYKKRKWKNCMNHFVKIYMQMEYII